MGKTYLHHVPMKTAARLQLSDSQSIPIDDSGLFRITDGSRVEIHCTGSGNLRWQSSSGVEIQVSMSISPTINLFQRSDPTNNEQILIIQTFSSADMAVYTCSTDLEVNGNTAQESLFITSGESPH